MTPEELMKTGIELLPCPFCGGEGKINLNEQDDFYFIECTQCLATSSIMYNSGDDAKPHVIDAWNKKNTSIYARRFETRF